MRKKRVSCGISKPKRNLRGCKLLGFSGAARSGKDTGTNSLAAINGFATYSLASPIKKACNEIFGWDERHENGDLKEVVDPFWGVSPRYAYQTMGTEWGRTLIRDDIWLKRAEMVLERCGNLIISDIRFPNEAEWIRNKGGVLVHIKRESAKKVLSHVSEAGLEIDYDNDIVIYNNSTIEDYHDNIAEVFNLIFEPQSLGE